MFLRRYLKGSELEGRDVGNMFRSRMIRQLLSHSLSFYHRRVSSEMKAFLEDLFISITLVMLGPCVSI